MGKINLKEFKIMEEVTVDVKIPLSVNVGELKTRVEKYNKKVEKYGGFDPLSYNEVTRELKGHFIPKSESGILKGAKHAYQNGDLYEDLKKILVSVS